GLDGFAMGKATMGLARAGKAADLFYLGIIVNCEDFWAARRELGIEYDKIYDVLVEGFRVAKLRRRREDDDDPRSISSLARKGLRKTL
ncbi:hypothetical protein FIBSPDRAFT_714573, partial [Athelia psychrophila]